MKYLSRVCASLALTIGGLSSVNADEYNHKYSKGDNVNFYVHKVS